MPFTFKLSKRLALLKASLAASAAALALACDRTDLTGPPPFPSPLTQVVTSLPVVAVVASGDDGNIPQNTLDNNLATRWSASGDGQWIRYDLGGLVAIDRVDIAWYVGDTRIAYFDIEVSPDTVAWTKVFSGQSSGQTLQPESYPFPAASGRYVRIVGHGNSTSAWNSITEVDLRDAELAVAAVLASGDDGNVPRNTLDNDLATRWSASGDGQWIRYDLDTLVATDRVDIAWHVGDARIAYFDIEVSSDAVTWTSVFSGQSSGQTLQPESYAFPTASGRYVRIVGHGNSTSAWNSITEVDLHRATTPPPTSTGLAVVAVVASADDGNVPQNTLDGDLATRWSADGDGQWIQYDLGALAAIGRASIAWYRGDARIAYFDIAVSPDAVTWTTVFSGQSSGQTLQAEGYDLPLASGRYVRIVGHGNSTSAWTSVTEVDLYGTSTNTEPPVASVTVTPASASILVGAIQPLSAVTKDSAGNLLTGRAVTWSSGPPAIAAVAPGLAVVSVLASADDGNVPQNTLDGDLATRWSADGDGQWIQYDLGARTTTDRVDIAWHRGDARLAYFDIQASPDAVTWTTVFSGQSSGQTLQPERYDFPPASGRYVRIVGHGNSLNGWNSITEVNLYDSASGAALATGLAAGVATITATSEGVSGTAAVTIQEAGDHVGSPDLEPGLVGRTDLVLFEDFEYADWETHWTATSYPENYDAVTSPAFQGSRGLEGRVPDGAHDGANLDFGFGAAGLAEPDAIYLRYYVRFNDTWQRSGDGEIGKFPGFGGTYNRCGWGGRPGDGTCWSARMMNFDAGATNQLGFYVYHADMSGSYGEHMRWSPLLERGRWYCVEAYVQLNSVSGDTGNYDGVLRGWIDGAPAMERTDLRFRTVTSTHVEKIWWNLYVGGSWTADRHMAIHFDNVVVARERIGCYSG